MTLIVLENSEYPDPGGPSAAGATATTPTGTTVTWDGDKWSRLTSNEVTSLKAMVSGAWNTTVPWIAALSKAPGARAVYDVMASPPTVAFTTTNAMSAGQRKSVTDTNGVDGGPYPFSLHRGGSPTVFNGQYLQCHSVNYGVGGQNVNITAYSCLFYGARIAIVVRGGGASLFVKVDDQYISATPLTNPSDGNTYYLDLTFATTSERRIEVLGSGFSFGGAWIGQNDTLKPAPLRGPRMIVVGDSITEGAGYTASGGAVGYAAFMSDYLGWDDVWQSGVGAAGYLQAPGDKLKFRDRLATDVYPYNPQIVMLSGGINDGAFTYAQVYAEVIACIDAITVNLPLAKIVVASPFKALGAGYTDGTASLPVYRAIRDACAARPATVWMDLWRMPLPADSVHTTTLSSSAGVSTSTLNTVKKLIPGAHYKFDDDSFFYVRASGGGGPYTATIDYCPTAQSAGANVTRVGDCWWTGSGKVGATTGWGNGDVFISNDGTHPTFVGHQAVGAQMGELMQKLFSLS